MSELKIRIAIADDHTIFRQAMVALIKRNFLDFSIVGEASTGQEIIRLCENTEVDVLLMDMKMPGIDGITATKNILRSKPQIKIVALSMFEEDTYVLSMVDAGAVGYLLKNINKKELGRAIRSVFNGNTYFSSGLLVKALQNQSHSGQNIRDLLSIREIEIIILICKGCTSVEIASRLFISVRTIEGYRAEILKKLQARNTAGIIAVALREHIVSEEDLLEE